MPMTTFWPSGKTVVTRLRVRCAGIDPIAAQLRVTSLFNAAHLQPAGLPPSAIICIRKLHDPLPGVLRLQQGQCVHHAPGSRLSPPRSSNWQGTQRVPRAAQCLPMPKAVIFLDRSELLACLASDWCDGSASTRWWWHSLFTGTDIAHAVLRAWLDAPEYISAALQHMTESRQAVTFVRGLEHLRRMRPG